MLSIAVQSAMNLNNDVLMREEEEEEMMNNPLLFPKEDENMLEEQPESYRTLEEPMEMDIDLNNSVLFKPIYTTCKKPKRSTDGSAGYDLFSAVEGYIPYGQKLATKVSVGFQMQLPPNTFGKICSRSGLATVNAIEVVGGGTVIDEDFRGTISIPLRNVDHETKEPYYIKIHDKIAQMVIQKYETPDWVETQTLSETKRGAKGFGSSGR